MREGGGATGESGLKKLSVLRNFESGEEYSTKIIPAQIRPIWNRKIELNLVRQGGSLSSPDRFVHSSVSRTPSFIFRPLREPVRRANLTR